MLSVRTLSQPTTIPKIARMGSATTRPCAAPKRRPVTRIARGAPYGRRSESSQPAVGQLLDRRRHQGDDEEEGDERAGAARVPLLRNETLFVRRAPVAEDREDALVDEGSEGIDREERQYGEADRPPPRGRSAKGEHLSPRQARRDEEEDAEHDPVLDERGDGGRVSVREVVRRLRPTELGRVVERAERRHDEKPDDEFAGDATDRR